MGPVVEQVGEPDYAEEAGEGCGKGSPRPGLTSSGRRSARRCEHERARRHQIREPVAAIEVDERPDSVEAQHDDEVHDGLRKHERPDRGERHAAEAAYPPLPHAQRVVASRPGL